MAIILLPPQTPPAWPPDWPQPVDWPPPPVEEEDGFDCGVPGGLVLMSRLSMFPSFPFCPKEKEKIIWLMSLVFGDQNRLYFYRIFWN